MGAACTTCEACVGQDGLEYQEFNLDKLEAEDQTQLKLDRAQSGPTGDPQDKQTNDTPTNEYGDQMGEFMLENYIMFKDSPDPQN